MKNLINCTFFICLSINIFSQNTVGLINYQAGNSDGYVLFSPMTSTDTYLIDKCGEVVNKWSTSTSRPALSCTLTNDGSLLRTGKIDNPNFTEGGNGGLIEKFDWNGNLTWSYTISGVDYVQHHDMKLLPNGNILVIVWDRHTSADAITNGKNTSYSNSYLWSEKIIEIQPVGTNNATIVWEWKLWDHLIQDFDNQKANFGVVADHPEIVNINYFPGQPTNVDWIHLNSIDYNPSTDQILVSTHTLNEIWILDHSTTTLEAASHSGGNSGKGGDLLYRWGNPQAYNRGNTSDKVYYGQHHATWIPSDCNNAGKIIVFNNGLSRPGTYSSIDIIDPPMDVYNQYPIDALNAFLPTDLFWSYTAPTPSDFYSSNISSVYPINNSFLITSGANGTIFEIDANKQTVWKYINPVTQSGITQQGNTPSSNLVFRSEFYPINYPGFSGKTLTPLGEIELNPTTPSICSQVSNINKFELLLTNQFLYPNPTNGQINLTNTSNVKITDLRGKIVLEKSNTNSIDISNQNEGIYFVQLFDTNEQLIQCVKIIKE